MFKFSKFMFTLVGWSVFIGSPAFSQEMGLVSMLSRPGVVDGSFQNSDEFIWRKFVAFTAPVSSSGAGPATFETWASDADVFNVSPHWPGADEPRAFHASALALSKVQPSLFTQQSSPHLAAISVPCNPPGNAAVGGFPTTGTPTPCIAEEVKRNRPQFDYIVGNNLNTKAGLAAAFAKAFKVEMPTDALSVKVDWVPVNVLLQWLPTLGSVPEIRKFYYTTTSQSVEYALVSMHVSSRQNPNWVWGTFEHQFNPGRCDGIGCADTFGAVVKNIPPNKLEANSQYGVCAKTPQLAALMSDAKVSPVWMNYCLKSTQVDFTSPHGTPYVLGNSVIEGITGNGSVPASSCITCHAYASFGANGSPTAAATAMLPFNPSGRMLADPLTGSQQFDFMWGVLLAP